MRPAIKKRLTIAAAVLGYLLIEAFLLLLVAKETGLRETLFLVSTLGMLAGFIYSGPMTARRALLVVTWVIASPPFMLMVVFALYPVIQKIGAMSETSGAIIEIAIVVLAIVSPTALPAHLTWKNRSLKALAEAERWLSDRERYGSSGVLRRSRLKRWSLWLPSMIVLATLFLWTPLQAVIDRFHDFRPGNLAGYRISVPLSWTTPIWRYEQDEHDLTLLRFRNFTSSALTLGQRQPIISGMTFTYGIRPDPRQNINGLLERDRQYGSDLRMHPLPTSSVVTSCWEYRPEGRYYYPAGDLWFATCSANDTTFEASFFGDRADLDSFYEIVSSAEVRK